MPKFLNLWEMDTSRMPADPNERAAMLGKLTEMTKKLLAEGKISDWGIFAGSLAGYSIAEGTAVDMQKLTMQFRPYVNSQIHSILSIDEVTEVLKSLMG